MGLLQRKESSDQSSYYLFVAGLESIRFPDVSVFISRATSDEVTTVAAAQWLVGHRAPIGLMTRVCE